MYEMETRGGLGEREITMETRSEGYFETFWFILLLAEVINWPP